MRNSRTNQPAGDGGEDRMAGGFASISQIAIYAALLVGWQVLLPLSGVPAFVVPTPLDVASALVRGFTTGSYLSDLGVTLFEMLSGFLIAALGGMLTGVLRGVAQGLHYAIENPRAAVRGHFEQFPNSRPTGMAEEKVVEQSAKVVSINVQLSEKSTMARRWGMASPQQIERVRDALIENGIIQKTLPWQDYYTPQFVDALNDYDLDAVVRKAKAAG